MKKIGELKRTATRNPGVEILEHQIPEGDDAFSQCLELREPVNGNRVLMDVGELAQLQVLIDRWLVMQENVPPIELPQLGRRKAVFRCRDCKRTDTYGSQDIAVGWAMGREFVLCARCYHEHATKGA